MADLIYDSTAIAPDERIFVVHVGRARPEGPVLASLEMDQLGPPGEAAPIFTGFELPANDLMRKARDRASEQGVQRIFVVDPWGLLRFAAASRR